MIATITYNLPEEQMEFDNSINGSKWQSVVYDLYLYLRNNSKYHDDNSPLSEESAYIVNDKIFEIMNDYGLKFN